ncbi:MAG: DNA polymerase III subunit alpha [Rickettsiaceae bacterium]
MDNKFIHFRLTSDYSFLESGLTVNKIVDCAIANKMPAICLSDNGNMFGALEFALAANSKNIQPIHGAVLKLKYQSSSSRESSLNDFAEILVVAKDKIGYQNLLKLTSYGFIKNDRKICNHITLQDLDKCNDGLILLSGYTKGIIGQSLLANNLDLASKWCSNLLKIFGDRFYFEIMRHGFDDERYIENAYLNLAYDNKIPLIATNYTFFVEPKNQKSYETLLCISKSYTKDNLDHKLDRSQFNFKNANAMSKLFNYLPEALENTMHLAQRCSIMAETRSPMLPKFSDNDSNVDENNLLRKLSHKGLLNHLKEFNEDQINQDVYFQRLEYELDIICKMGFAGYFLIVSDFIKWSKSQNIAVGPGRGSGAASIVAWSMFITEVDPIKFGLIFERFLNPERVSLPDFDIDFCQERREEVINYVRSKYGDDKVGQIITFGKMQAKAVIKDVSRVLGLPYQYANYITELIPFDAVNPVTITRAINDVAELKNAYNGKGLYNLPGNEDLIKQVIYEALDLEGLNRHASVHAAGIVISSTNLLDVVPLYQDMNSDMLIIQYSMKYSELSGLMKFDFLGLQTLTVINNCVELLKERNINVDLEHCRFDDSLTYEILSKGCSSGVFQFESIGMKDNLKRLKPDSINDLIALGALYRPGPMENIPTYIACKHRKSQPNYIHSILKPILESTYGVIIYQEQVLEIARVFAGYTLGGADLLRRAMGKKIRAEMDDQEAIFIRGAQDNGIDKEQAKEVFEAVSKFAGYGFNKAHAAAYAVISYKTAYLKANFPAEFLVVCLNLDIHNHHKLIIFLEEAKEFGIEIIAPDINLSDAKFTASNIQNKDQSQSITYGIGAIKNVGIAFAQSIVQERERNGKFESVIDFIQRIEPKSLNRRTLEHIIKAGCFDSLHNNRHQLIVNISKLMSYAESYHMEQHSNQYSLIPVKNTYELSSSNLNEYDYSTKAFFEFDVFGFFIHNHPLYEYENVINLCNIKDTRHIKNDIEFGFSKLKIAGVILKKDTRMSARGSFVSLQLSDQYGVFDITIFKKEMLQEYNHLLNVKTIIVVYCDVFKDNNGLYRLTPERFIDINSMIKYYNFTLELQIDNESILDQILSLLKCAKTLTYKNTKISITYRLNKYFDIKINMESSYSLNAEQITFLNQYNKQTMENEKRSKN